MSKRKVEADDGLVMWVASHLLKTLRCLCLQLSILCNEFLGTVGLSLLIANGLERLEEHPSLFVVTQAQTAIGNLCESVDQTCCSDWALIG